MSRFAARGSTLIATTVAILFSGCGQGLKQPTAGRPAVLRLAVTTSTRDSGLLDVLVPLFEREYEARVDVIAVGTGAALKLGEAGDADVVLVHSRSAEDAFMENEHGIRREEVMYNTFEMLGPRNDPSEVRRLDPVQAVQAIAKSKKRFVSRGDESGTHRRELTLWHKGGGRPQWDEYVESGQGMGATLIMADQMSAYVLTDRGTYLKLKDKIQLVPLVERSEVMQNPYGIMVVNPKNHPGINGDLANEFVDFMIASATQQLIQDYQLSGETLFYPLRLPTQIEQL